MIETVGEIAGRWQPIETAPKDGLAVWVGAPCGNNGAWGMEPVRTMRHFYGEWANIYSGNSIEFVPTHWMPLPDAPGVRT